MDCSFSAWCLLLATSSKMPALYTFWFGMALPLAAPQATPHHPTCGPSTQLNPTLGQLFLMFYSEPPTL
jgi:hypothetical protein